ncbi:MAG: P1 family peptidase [Anaerolineales bacterium]|nr:P1 family peptidase [Anaerolineales bacterium]
MDYALSDGSGTAACEQDRWRKEIVVPDLTITSVPGIKLGHAQDEEALTGCTVVLCENGAVAGVDQRGGAPGTRETDLLRPMHMVEKVHALVLSGGSAYGLDAASGVMRYLEEQKIGFHVQVAKVPIVPAAVLFDLALGKADVRPDAEMGYTACLCASNDRAAEGNVGAGMGASVGKIFGMAGAMKAGIGSAAVDLGGGVVVGAVIAVNAFGDVFDPQTGRILAGARPARIGPLKFGGDGAFADTLATMKSTAGKTTLKLAMKANTVIGVVATNAALTKEEANKVAQMSQDGLARVIRPAHTMLDGDTIFACSTGSKKADVNIIGAYAAEVVAESIIRAVQQAVSLGNLPAAADYQP